MYMHIYRYIHVYTCVPPVVELAEAGASSALGIQLYSRHSQPHETCEQTLLHVGVLLERHVLHHWGKLGKCEGGGGRGDGREGGGMGGRGGGRRGEERRGEGDINMKYVKRNQYASNLKQTKCFQNSMPHALTWWWSPIIITLFRWLY